MIVSGVPFLLMLAAIVVLAATGNLISSSPIVIALQAAAIALNLWARSAFQVGTFRVDAAPAGSSVIRRGPYRFIRHPMYAAMLLFIWASIGGHRSPLTVTLGVAVAALAVARVVAEDRLLIEQFPEYLEYSRTTKALIPFLF
jgi:protein-S-isoprenylcysteine O-methyltransferase Ste14